MLRNTIKAMKNVVTNRVDFVARNVRSDRWFNNGIELAMFFTSEENAHFVNKTWDSISKSHRLTPKVQQFIRGCYKRGLVKFENEESKLHYCGVWDSDQLDK